MVKAYWKIGQAIVEEEQHGHQRAVYGKAILKELSKKLQSRYPQGFSVDSLEQCRKFYLIYQSVTDTSISETASRKLITSSFSEGLSWSHYCALMRVDRPEARQFYEVEAINNAWTVRELRRQIGSLLFDRLAMSKDKAGLLELAEKGQEIRTPADTFKDPTVLEFFDMSHPHQMTETELEQAIINHLQQFLLELGKGFAFIARQKRITLDNDHFYCDLVFYHVILKCYVVLDIKTHALTHGDLGQMQFYVNYFDREIRTESDSPTLGLILCTEKNDAMAQYTLGDKSQQIFASKYQFHLPTEEELVNELKREIKQIQAEHNQE
jgi:predicted nuclease of restriction endonuclease-like (RecB) superfamily